MRVKKINDFYRALIEYWKNGYIAHHFFFETGSINATMSDNLLTVD